jgi:RimJ/RimL family protein N-acetyltransferase
MILYWPTADMNHSTFLPCSCNGVRLRRLAVNDLAAFQAYRHDAELGRYQGWSPTSDVEAAAFLAQMSTAVPLQPGVWLQIGIAEDSTDLLVGDIGLLLDENGKQVEIGFTLRRASQGRGMATIALTQAMALVFRHTAVERIIAVTDARNIASIRLLERIGLRRVSSVSKVFRDEECVEHTYVLARQTLA